MLLRRALQRVSVTRHARRAASSSTAYAAAPYRALAFATDAEKSAWAERDATLHEEMRKRVPAALAHNGEESFDDHLVGVQSVLRSWGAPERVCDAALFHSIYGTEGFQGYALPLAQRPDIAGLIGARAERLAWIFCMVDRWSVDEIVLGMRSDLAFRARPELGGFPLVLENRGEYLDFLALTLADWLEQVEGSSTKAVRSPVLEEPVWDVGECWGYRRASYARMAEILEAEGEPWAAAAAPKMYAEVFANEPASSKDVVIERTPPMSEAALRAQEAMASVAFVAAA